MNPVQPPRQLNSRPPLQRQSRKPKTPSQLGHEQSVDKKMQFVQTELELLKQHPIYHEYLKIAQILEVGKQIELLLQTKTTNLNKLQEIKSKMQYEMFEAPSMPVQRERIVATPGEWLPPQEQFQQVQSRRDELQQENKELRREHRAQQREQAYDNAEYASYDEVTNNGTYQERQEEQSFDSQGNQENYQARQNQDFQEARQERRQSPQSPQREEEEFEKATQETVRRVGAPRAPLPPPELDTRHDKKPTDELGLSEDDVFVDGLPELDDD